MMLLGLASGCASGPADRASAGASSRSGAVAPVASTAPTVAEWATLALERIGDASTEARVRAGIRENERAFFMEVLGRLARETRDVGPVVHLAARSWVSREGVSAAAAIVSEVWSRECCLRRSFLVAALDGVWVGMGGTETAKLARVVDASTALKLQELAEHPDAGVARAARTLGSRFATEAGGAEAVVSGNR